MASLGKSDPCRNIPRICQWKLGGERSEANGKAGLTQEGPRRNDNLPTSVVAMDKNVPKLAETIKNFTNPYTSTTDLYNTVTKVVVPENIKSNLGQQSKIGRVIFSFFEDERIKSGKQNLWAPMKRRKLLTWKSSGEVCYQHFYFMYR